jgi:peptidoglycan/xylan/chitin deacetylase (PgdA/CDA1 family)
VALTFDDGPNPLETPQVLHVLETHGARGTFFLLGQCAQRYPDLVARILRGGHAIGNHSWDHPSFPAIKASERRRQIRECGRALGDARVKLFRPPYGDQTVASRLDPLWLGWEVVAWSISGTDWRGDGAGTIAERILRDLHPGSIVLLHDALFRYEDARFVPRAATIAALSTVLQAAAGRFRFVTVPELLRLGEPNRELWIQPGKADYVAGLKSGET